MDKIHKPCESCVLYTIASTLSILLTAVLIKAVARSWAVQTLTN
jgi:hypothetical protein